MRGRTNGPESLINSIFGRLTSWLIRDRVGSSISRLAISAEGALTVTDDGCNDTYDAVFIVTGDYEDDVVNDAVGDHEFGPDDESASDS